MYLNEVLMRGTSDFLTWCQSKNWDDPHSSWAKPRLFDLHVWSYCLDSCLAMVGSRNVLKAEPVPVLMSGSKMMSGTNISWFSRPQTHEVFAMSLSSCFLLQAYQHQHWTYKDLLSRLLPWASLCCSTGALCRLYGSEASQLQWTRHGTHRAIFNPTKTLLMVEPTNSDLRGMFNLDWMENLLKASFLFVAAPTPLRSSCLFCALTCPLRNRKSNNPFSSRIRVCLAA